MAREDGERYPGFANTGRNNEMRRPFLSLLTPALLVLVTAGAAEAAAGPVAKEAEVNGVRLTYVEQGSGTPMVLVHGAVADLRNWEPARRGYARNPTRW